MTLPDFSQPDTRVEHAPDARMFAELSHEIRTPLTALLGNVELLLEGAWEEHDPLQAHGMLRIVQQSGQHVLELVNNVLAWAGPDAGAAVHRHPLGPRELCEQTLAWLSPRASMADVTLRCTAAPSTPPVIFSDAGRLRQILLNLIGNAIKFTPRGAVSVELCGIDSAGRAMAEVGESTWLRIDIRDTGIGIDDAQLARLFQPFSPGASRTHAPYTGAGLGLAISLRLCEALGGRITVHSRQGSGSLFRVELPVGAGAALAETTADRAVADNDRPLSGYRILLADDSSETRRIVALVLRQAGADVTEVANGREACALALTAWRRARLHASAILRPFDAVVLDLQMPVCDGITAAQELRAAGYTAPLIALTAATDPQQRAACAAAGFNAFSAKPLDRRALVETLSQWCGAAAAAV